MQTAGLSKLSLPFRFLLIAEARQVVRGSRADRVADLPPSAENKGNRGRFPQHCEAFWLTGSFFGPASPQKQKNELLLTALLSFCRNCRSRFCLFNACPRAGKGGACSLGRAASIPKQDYSSGPPAPPKGEDQKTFFLKKKERKKANWAVLGRGPGEGRVFNIISLLH